MILSLKERCLSYRTSLPFRDDKPFLEFCFLLRMKSLTPAWQHKSFNILKFAIMLDESYLGMVMLDPESNARELAQILTDHQDLIWTN